MSLLLKAESDPTFSEIIGRHLDQNLSPATSSAPLQRTGFRRIGLPTIYTRGEGQEKAMTKQVGAVIEIRSDGTGLFVIFDGVKIAKRGPPGRRDLGFLGAGMDCARPS